MSLSQLLGETPPPCENIKSCGLSRMSLLLAAGGIAMVFVIPIVGGLAAAVGFLLGVGAVISGFVSKRKKTGLKFAWYGIALSATVVTVFIGMVGGFA